MIALIDADVICYMAAYVGAPKIDWGDGDGKVAIPTLTRAKEVADQIVKDWIEIARADSALLVFSDRTSDKTSFRYHVHPHYKDQRENEKPELHNELLDYLRKSYKSKWLPGLEGDDTMGLMATKYDKYVMVSNDKDLCTVPAPFIRIAPRRPGQAPAHTSFRGIEHEADWHWMFQTMVGDTIDNYKGCPGIGEKGAEKFLDRWRGAGVAHMWEYVVEEFEKMSRHPKWGTKFITNSPHEEFLINARCARILRHGDYEGGKVRLWSPVRDDVWISVKPEENR